MDNYLVFEWYISMSQMVLTIKLENNSKYKKVLLHKNETQLLTIKINKDKILLLVKYL